MLHDINRLYHGLIASLAGWLACTVMFIYYTRLYLHWQRSTDSIYPILQPFISIDMCDVSVHTIRFSWYNSNNNNNGDVYCCSMLWCSFASTLIHIFIYYIHIQSYTGAFLCHPRTLCVFYSLLLYSLFSRLFNLFRMRPHYRIDEFYLNEL